MADSIDDQLAALQKIKTAISFPGSGWPILDHIQRQLERALGEGNYPKPLVGDLAELRSELLDLSIRLERLMTGEPFTKDEMETFLHTFRSAWTLGGVGGIRQTFEDVCTGIDETIGPDD
ncbi:hypothetical protein ABI59_16115 [Acidobacteria bacterium Mor1]|nr:hypothetical protein ABI59_16115 [Acidobacteria bacterium Mor1]